MKINEDENEDPLSGMIQTLLVVVLAIFLQQAITNNVSWYWSIGMGLVIVVYSIVKPFSTRTKSQANTTKEITPDNVEDIEVHSLPPLNTMGTR